MAWGREGVTQQAARIGFACVSMARVWSVGMGGGESHVRQGAEAWRRSRMRGSHNRRAAPSGETLHKGRGKRAVRFQCARKNVET
jgi:hypothetical protein